MKSIRIASRVTRSLPLRPTTRTAFRPSTCRPFIPSSRCLSTTSFCRKGMTPDSSDPEPPKTESSTSTNAGQISELADSEYHEISDQYLNSLVLALEEQAESDKSLEVEYSAGVLTITQSNGTYVINKQPPNKQIWLSSPVSGPKRFDWVMTGAGQHEKEESGYGGGDDGEGGKWVYMRDGSTLSDILKQEIGVEVAPGEESDVNVGREGPGGGGSKMESESG